MLRHVRKMLESRHPSKRDVDELMFSIRRLIRVGDELRRAADGLVLSGAHFRVRKVARATVAWNRAKEKVPKR